MTLAIIVVQTLRKETELLGPRILLPEAENLGGTADQVGLKGGVLRGVAPRNGA